MELNLILNLKQVYIYTSKQQNIKILEFQPQFILFVLYFNIKSKNV